MLNEFIQVFDPGKNSLCAGLHSLGVIHKLKHFLLHDLFPARPGLRSYCVIQEWVHAHRLHQLHDLRRLLLNVLVEIGEAFDKRPRDKVLR